MGWRSLKQKSREHFIDRFTQENFPDVDLEMEDLSKMSPIQASGLEVENSLEEVKTAVWA